MNPSLMNCRCQPISRSERLARERVDRVKAALLRNMTDPPSLANLARIAGCSGAS